MAMTKLEKLGKALKRRIDKGHINYTVPDLWNAWDYQGEELRRLPNNELLINPYRFYSSLITDYILPKKEDKLDYSRSLSTTKNVLVESLDEGGRWIKESVLYSTLIRSSAAWDHDRSNSLDTSNFNGLKETGTFVKMLAMLPFLKKMGVDTLYLLPISKFSLKDKKGELGSPYGIQNFFELDPNLKDDLTGNQLSINEEFQALVEACHILDMRVVIDFIPRTNAVENDLIGEHPDWFYWIKASEYDKYKVPYVKSLNNTLPPSKEVMDQVYLEEDVIRHINMFQKNPKEQDPELFNKVLNMKGSLAENIEKLFDLRIAPAFSDHINDVQPPWTDVTFFRMYLDHPKETVKYLKNKQTNPYILFDTIKSNLFPGKVPNMDLWNVLSNIIPHFQHTFGIDGVRIDMGHALPEDLLKMIIDKAKSVDPDFSIIAEELNPDNSDKAKRLGYNSIIGNGFWMEPRVWENKFHEFVYSAPKTSLPMFACCETHDTQRMSGRPSGRVLTRLATTMNMLLPNLVPFINSGQEVYEPQPMNTGVDCTDKDKYNLPEHDIFYGKLALFDKYAFHYMDHSRWELADHLDGIKHIRHKWLSSITNLEYYQEIGFKEYGSFAIGVSYFDTSNQCLLVVGNTNYNDYIEVRANIQELRRKAHNKNTSGKLLYSTYEFGRDFDDISDDEVFIKLQPGELKVIEF